MNLFVTVCEKFCPRVKPSLLTLWISCLQLINELGSVDARLAPQFRELLTGEKDETASRPPEGKKTRGAAAKTKMVRFVFSPDSECLASV